MRNERERTPLQIGYEDRFSVEQCMKIDVCAVAVLLCLTAGKITCGGGYDTVVSIVFAS